MENQTAPNNHPHADLINTFTTITSSSPQEALFFLESHNFDLDAAVSTFFETSAAVAADDDAAIPVAAERTESLSPESTPSRSRSPSPQLPTRPQSDRVYNLRSRRQGSDKKASGSRGGRIQSFSDLNKKDEDDSDSDEKPQEYYTGGEKSGMIVQDPSKGNDVDALFDQARQAGVERHGDHLQPSSSSRNFTGTARLLSGETISNAPSHPETVTHNITLWTNGFTVDDGPLRRMDDPENASFLESIRKSECPQELAPADRRTVVHVNLMRKEQECPVPKKRPNSFQGQGRTLGSNNDVVPPVEPTVVSNLQSAPPPSMGLVVDQALPSTSIQLRLADGTRMVSRFNFHHTVRDIRGFIDASRPAAPRSYHLQTVGFPPKQLTNQDQTIEEAGLANSVVIQKL
ncbi:Serine/threonine protein phosphatase 2A 55 kDa regulatory subunit B prime gamma [Heracleum sosnowskyi]|uniref:Serine/threonine protein phosphatase 2A 55 kDa regulatory subunit B prime gamma n=1 Tax=Heracleum sosnowskyi TaxID=360622 RepID=A0AAD8IRE2_9APIA|nr:Serine/threonine protein phosphatase 2A 55 kDa regulatory subunit B prime gamma [Heracleum sosnowskyi]